MGVFLTAVDVILQTYHIRNRFYKLKADCQSKQTAAGPTGDYDRQYTSVASTGEHILISTH